MAKSHPKPNNNTNSTKNQIPVEATQSDRLFSSIFRKYVVAVVLGIGLAAVSAYFFNRWMTVATVNGTAITRSEYTRELEKMSGKQVLDGLITKNIILQEAEARNISVSKEEVETELKKLEEQLKSQGQSLDQILALQGGTRENIREQISLSKTLEKLVGNDVPVSTEEVATFIEQNPTLAADKNANLDQLRAQATEQLKKQKIDQKIQQLIQDLRQKANIRYFNE
ncbi:MAG: SurA N-terminal domain-containing protein [Patescibacteria group bacterium]|nr:SurA N-terminal domain-containing protein [Patescibacteria group bacterium]